MTRATDAARAMRAIPSEARAEASRANGRRGGSPGTRRGISWEVEEHTGGRSGVGRGPATGSYATASAARAAIRDARERGNDATVIRREPDGRGRIGRLSGDRLVYLAR